MQLTCPNCAAAYRFSDAAMPASGTHVQCSACHTRWFARPSAPPPEALSEDEILVRLATRAPAARPPSDAADKAASSARRAGQTIPFPAAAKPAAPEPAASPEAAAPAVAAPVLRAAPAPLSTAEPGATPLRPRPGPDRPMQPAPAPVVRRSRFGHGLGIGLVLGALGLGLYLRGEALAALVPAARPAVEVYVAQIDALRALIEDRLGPVRDRLVPAQDG